MRGSGCPDEWVPAGALRLAAGGTTPVEAGFAAGTKPEFQNVARGRSQDRFVYRDHG